MQNLAERVLLQQLSKNPNSVSFKEVIQLRAQQVQKTVYWYYTNCQGEYLQNLWENNVNQKAIVKNRISKITEDAWKEVEFQIGLGNILRPGDEPHVQSIGQMYMSQLVQKYDTPEMKTQYFSSNHPKTKEIQDKLRHINQDQEKFKEKINQIKRKEQQKKLQHQQQQIEIRKRLEEQKRALYRKQVQKKVQQQKQHQEERKRQNQKFKLFLKQYKSSKPLHVLMQEEFKARVQLPRLEERAKELNDWERKHVKPTLQQINRHDQQFISRKLNKPQRSFVAHQTIDVGYKSKFYEKEHRKMVGLDSDEQEETMDFFEKKKRYSEFVKQKFKPKMRLHVSVDKPMSQSKLTQNQGSQVIESTVKNSRRKFRDVTLQVPDRSRYIEVGKTYLEFVKNLDKKRNLHTSQSPTSSQLHTDRPAYHNYLQDLKYEHRTLHKGVGSNWEHDLHDKTSSMFQKRDRVLMKSKQLEERAYREQQFVNLSTHAKPSEVISKKGRADDILIESIRAKVAVLKEVSRPV